MKLRSEITRIRGLCEMPQRGINMHTDGWLTKDLKERTTGSNKDGKQGRKETDTGCSVRKPKQPNAKWWFESSGLLWVDAGVFTQEHV